jgi:hypothetical protein
MKRACVLLFILFALLVVAGCGSSGPTAAETYAKGVYVTLDVTTVEDMMDQMAPLPASTPPPGVTQESELTPARYRVYTWTFPDGSAMVFSFRTKGEEGSGQGLVLDHIELTD